MIKPGAETYLGDGVYVSHDGYQLCLRADSQRVYVNDAVWESLTKWVGRKWGERLEGPGAPSRSCTCRFVGLIHANDCAAFVADGEGNDL